MALVYQQPHPRLVAYYTAQAPLPEATLQHFLATALPEYMVPETFIWLKEWPVTVNGKLDRRALPEPSLPVVQERVAPQSEREAQIAAIVAEMMGIDEAHFSCEANLYQLGLDSIMAIKLVSKLRRAMGVSIRVKDVFASKTVHALHLRLAQHQQQVMIEGKREQGVLVGELPLLPVQRWFFDCAFPYPSYWNRAFLLDVPALDVERLRAALHALIQHHDALRLTFTSEDSLHWRQGYQPMTDAIELRCHHVERSAPQWQEALSAVLTEWQSDIDLADGPLYRFGYVTGFDEGEPVFSALATIWCSIASAGAFWLAIWRTPTTVKALGIRERVIVSGLSTSSNIVPITRKRRLTGGTGWRTTATLRCRLRAALRWHAAASRYQ